MVVLAEEGDLLGPDLLPAELREAVAGERPDPIATARERAAARPGPRTLRQSVAELERQMIADALTHFRGNKARVARELGLSYPTLLGRIRSYGLEREES
jgi:DNA-binding NtrC family response regulator